jgi:hypothetical protein
MTDMTKAIKEKLWNDEVNEDNYVDARDKYQATILEQYKLYVEMADRVSNRRGLANTFFLTLNSGILTVLAVFWKDPPRASVWPLLFPLLGVIGQCIAWRWIVRSYRQLNGAKYAVVGALEERLPAYQFSKAEWDTALARGKDWRMYLPLSHLEEWVPVLFGLVYAGSFLALVLTH